MKLWLLQQDINNGYDTYDSCVVAAETEEEAKKIHPSGDQTDWTDRRSWPAWAENNPSAVYARYIGEADECIAAGTVLCSSFHAG